MKYPAYPSYKESGVQWLGEMPEEWDISAVWHLFFLGRGRVISHEDIREYSGPYPVYSSQTENDGILGYLGEYDFEGDYITWTTDGANAGTVFRRMGKFNCTNVCGTLLPKSEEKINTKFAMYALNIATAEYVRHDINPKLMNNVMSRIRFGLPSFIEQTAIADFLDRETGRIDTLVAKKRQLIELLKEKRIALVHDAIHHKATTKLRIENVARQIKRPIDRKDDESYTPIGLFNHGRGIFHKETTIGAKLGESEFFGVKPDDLILSGQFAWEGAVALATDREANCVVSHRYPILQGKPGIMETAYLFAFFTTKAGDFLLDEHSRGAAGRNRPLNTRTLLKAIIPVPPINVQHDISKLVYFEGKFRKIVEDSIKLLREYRTALITSTVTGKIDVRQEVA